MLKKVYKNLKPQAHFYIFIVFLFLLFLVIYTRYIEIANTKKLNIILDI